MPTLLVTGANRGLGLEFAGQYAAEGWTVHACVRDPASARELAARAKKTPGRIVIHALDVRDEAAARRLADELKTASLDLLINNAGIYGDESFGSGLADVKAEVWLDTFRVNAVAPLLLARAFLPHVERGAHKRLVFITSKMGSIADNTGGGSLMYRSSKAALNASVKCLSLEVKPRGMTAVLLHPGWVRTDMGGAEAPLTPGVSVEGMRRVISGLGPADSGRFLDFNGRDVPW